MSFADPELRVVMYHYVRDLPNTRYPKIKGTMVDDFREQIAWLTSNCEMASLEAALAFLQGAYRPARDLFLLTFDDGLKEHYTHVMPILSEYRIQGLFGVITSCVEDRVVAPVHMNHFLMAEMGFEAYRSSFLRLLDDSNSDVLASVHVDSEVAQKSYPLDSRSVATFKFFFNFSLDASVRDPLVTSLFEEYIGDQAAFAGELYMSWEEIRQLQRAGMLIAGHTHRHRPLATLTNGELKEDLSVSRNLLDRRLAPQQLWPFSYPYGKKNSYSATAIGLLQQLRFSCAFNTESAPNEALSSSVFEISRIDCNCVVAQRHN